MVLHPLLQAATTMCALAGTLAVVSGGVELYGLITRNRFMRSQTGCGKRCPVCSGAQIHKRCSHSLAA